MEWRRGAKRNRPRRLSVGRRNRVIKWCKVRGALQLASPAKAGVQRKMRREATLYFLRSCYAAHFKGWTPAFAGEASWECVQLRETRVNSYRQGSLLGDLTRVQVVVLENRPSITEPVSRR